MGGEPGVSGCFRKQREVIKTGVVSSIKFNLAVKKSIVAHVLGLTIKKLLLALANTPDVRPKER